MSRKLNRRDFIKLLTAGTGGLVIVACTPETITVIETQEVIKEVTPTAAAQVQAAVADVHGFFPPPGVSDRPDAHRACRYTRQHEPMGWLEKSGSRPAKPG